MGLITPDVVIVVVAAGVRVAAVGRLAPDVRLAVAGPVTPVWFAADGVVCVVPTLLDATPDLAASTGERVVTGASAGVGAGVTALGPAADPHPTRLIPAVDRSAAIVHARRTRT